jgi:hypothetical protein
MNKKSKILKLSLLILLLSSMCIFSQIRNFNDIPKNILKDLDKMGVDDSPFLNNYESAFLNVIFKDKLKGFDFTMKKIGFIRNGGKGKVLYFEMQRKYTIDKNSPCDNGTLYIFNTTQKTESGGYDAAIVYWNKIVIPIDKVIKKLK